MSRLGSARTALAIVAAAAAAVALIPGSAIAKPGADRVVVKIDGLNSPRGLETGPARRLVYAQADGSITQTILRGPNAGTTVLGSLDLPADSLAPAVAQADAKSAYILTAAGEGDTSAKLYYWSKASGEITMIADIAAYQATDPDPYNQEGEDTESNPFGVYALPDGSALVSDAAGNDLLHVWPDGNIVTVARLMPRTVLVAEELEGQPGIPPPGTPIVAEGVATSVTVGADGAYYVGELRGFPATPGTSEIWRIEPDAEGAVCDPENPDKGDCTRYADGLTSLVDLDGAPDGSIYAVSLVKQSWLQFELGIADPIGGLYKVTPDGKKDLQSSDRLILPGGVAITTKGKAWVAAPTLGEGVIARVR
jgi:hypothetical protein